MTNEMKRAMKFGWIKVCLWLLCMAGLPAGHALAQEMTKEQTDAVWIDAKEAALNGPTTANLLDQAVLTLPADHFFVPQPYAGKLMLAMGNPGNDPRLVGLVFPVGDANWFMTVRFEPAGYVKDNDAKDWDTDELLSVYRSSTQAANESRAKQGLAALEILGWAQTPQYDAATHRLVWAMSSRDSGAPATQDQSVNYNTYALGRHGYLNLTLVSDLQDLPKYKPFAQALLAGVQFLPGTTYAEFNPTTDKVSDTGLATLVVGAAANRLGFVAKVKWYLHEYKVAVYSLLGFFGFLLLAGFVLRFLASRNPALADSLSRFSASRLSSTQSPATQFAATRHMEMDPVSDAKTVPMPLAPHPHADQVSTPSSR